MMGSAQQEAVSRKACPYRVSHSTAKGATPNHQLVVAGLEKGYTIPCGLRLDLAVWGGSVSVIIVLKDYYGITRCLAVFVI